MSELIENHAISKWMLISITINGSLVFDLDMSMYNSDTKFETPEEQKQKDLKICICTYSFMYTHGIYSVL